jgi:hypothetical protein
MRPVGGVWEVVQAAIRQYDEDTLKSIQKVCQNRYYDIVRMTDWAPLRRKTELVFTADETDGEYLPGDMVAVTSVVSEVDGSETPYSRVEQSERYLTGGRKRWYHPNVAVTPVITKTRDIDVETGATTYSGTLTGAAADQYIRFINTDSVDTPVGIYKLTAAGAFTPAYWGPRLKDKGAEIRPATTKKLVIIDDAGDLESDTVQVYHWVYPEPLYKNWQLPLLPATRALELMTIISMLEEHEKRVNEAKPYREELMHPVTGAGALSDMLEMNPKTVSPSIPRGRRGQVMFMGRRRDIGYIR